MHDIITFGSAIKDFFLFLKGDFCFPLDEKILTEEFFSSSGGGGTNTAATFAKMGFKTAYCGKIGDDVDGKEITEELEKTGIDTGLIKKDKKHHTTASVIFSFPGTRKRTIFICQGASFFVDEKDIDWRKIKTSKWFYFSPFYGESLKVFPKLADFAAKNKIKIAVNPGKEQINKKAVLEKVLKNTDLLILNREESFLLTGEKNEKACLKKMLSFGAKRVVITKGKDGAISSDGKYTYHTVAPKIKIAETTGAGDAYGSGFLSGIMLNNNMEYASKLAMANSTSCVQKIGAKNGLLKKGENGLMDKIKVKKEKFDHLKI